MEKQVKSHAFMKFSRDSPLHEILNWLETKKHKILEVMHLGERAVNSIMICMYLYCLVVGFVSIFNSGLFFNISPEKHFVGMADVEAAIKEMFQAPHIQVSRTL